MRSPLELLLSDPLAFALLAGAIVVALSLHEYAHALAADLQGDRLPRAMGRLTPNPARHLDPIGTALIFLVGFGWARPVEFRPSALASRRFGAAIVALAGPAMNVALALAGAFALRLTDGRGSLEVFLVTFALINVGLAVFNLIPIPPLDGSRLLTIFLPPDKQRLVFFLDRYGMFILLGLLLFGGPLLRRVIEEAAGWVFGVAGFPV